MKSCNQNILNDKDGKEFIKSFVSVNYSKDVKLIMNYTIIGALIVVLLLILEKRVSGSSLRIVGGDAAPFEYGKFHASIQNLTGHHICGGAVVSKLIVVTAAHCVYGANPAYMKIVSGTNNLNTGGKRYDVAEILINQKFDTYSRENDIALLKTKHAFDLRKIQILKLRKHDLVEGDWVLLSGFGAKKPNGLSSHYMQTLNLTVFNQETCKFAMRYAKRPVTDQMFCTFSKQGEGTCHGDSGSPLVKGQELVGIVAWGIPCAVGFPDVHTRISPYIDWIQKHIKKSNCKPRKSSLQAYIKVLFDDI